MPTATLRPAGAARSCGDSAGSAARRGAAAVEGIDAVSHQAAMVGLGLDFAEVGDYVGANDLGTARLLAALARADFRGP
ncbi:MAG TPA: hypothetical protein VGG40_10525, partial [Solirubrobacterales bacterium]